MAVVELDFGPKQAPITEERIRDMQNWQPRRCRLADWQTLHEPSSPDKDWSVVFPFCETLENAFDTMCCVDHIGMRLGKDGRCYTFLKNWQDNQEILEKVRAWLATVGPYVAIRDGLALSFALDYEREGGDPQKEQTEVAKLRARAKPYKRQPTEETYRAADQLASLCLDFLRTMTCYDSTDAVIAIPPSRTDKPFDLPRYLARNIAEQWGRDDLTYAVQLIVSRSAAKDLPLDRKLEALKGTIEVDKDLVGGKVILLIDDLYQSGTSMNYLGMLLLEAGAKKVFGLACEKTCRNDANPHKGW